MVWQIDFGFFFFFNRFQGMLEADPDAVWLMQGWLFLFSRFWYPERFEHSVVL
jgi:hypothetical protein